MQFRESDGEVTANGVHDAKSIDLAIFVSNQTYMR